MTQAGEITVSRIYLKCVKCGAGGYPVDERLGIEGRYSKQAQRLICLAAASWSYDMSSDHLQEFCGLSVSDTTIREVAQDQALYPDPDQASQWIAQARAALLNTGWSGVSSLTSRSAAERTLSAAPRSETSETEVLDKLRNYLSPHADHLHYAERLREGRSIGSGQVEGACKNLIGRRLKANAARWRTRRVNRMAGLCSLAYSNRWGLYWESA